MINLARSAGEGGSGGKGAHRLDTSFVSQDENDCLTTPGWYLLMLADLQNAIEHLRWGPEKQPACRESNCTLAQSL